MDKVMHFEIPVDDKNRAKDFYESVFSWKTKEMSEMHYVFLTTGPTDKKGMATENGFINGGMMRRMGQLKSVMITIKVDSIEKTVKKVKEGGGKVVKEKMKVGDMGFVAYLKDTEGNVISVWEDK